LCIFIVSNLSLIYHSLLKIAFASDSAFLISAALNSFSILLR
jgi:hypothetical protein